jgi:hypothetical protein
MGGKTLHRAWREIRSRSPLKVGDITTRGGRFAEKDSRRRTLRIRGILLQEEDAEVAEEKLQQPLDRLREQIWVVRSSPDRTRSTQRS